MAADEEWWWTWEPDVRPYAVLLWLLVDRRLIGEEFEVVFPLLFARDRTDWTPGTFDVLSGLVADVARIRARPVPGPQPDGIDETELRRHSAAALESMSPSPGGRSGSWNRSLPRPGGRSRRGGPATSERYWSSWDPATAPYAVQLRVLIDGRASGGEFETIFFRFFQEDPTGWSADVFNVLDTFFAEVDDFCGDAELRAEVGGIDEVELRRCATVAYQRLAEFSGRSGRSAGPNT